jgi:hypothetical protein
MKTTVNHEYHCSFLSEPVSGILLYGMTVSLHWIQVLGTCSGPLAHGRHCQCALPVAEVDLMTRVLGLLWFRLVSTGAVAAAARLGSGYQGPTWIVLGNFSQEPIHSLSMNELDEWAAATHIKKYLMETRNSNRVYIALNYYVFPISGPVQ